MSSSLPPIEKCGEKAEGVPSSSTKFDIHSIIVLQKYFQSYKERMIFEKHRNECVQRTVLIYELWETEKNYIKGLSSLDDLFIGPLKKNESPIKNAEDIRNLKSIFSEIEVILGINREICHLITLRVTEWDQLHSTIGDIFLSPYFDGLKYYADYLKKYWVNINLLRSLMNGKPDVAEFIFNTENNACQGQDLNMLLLTPVQRVPRYELIVSAILKATWKEHKDYEYLIRARQKLKVINEFLNKKMREGEGIQRLMDIQSRTIGLESQKLITASRFYIMEITVKGTIPYHNNHNSTFTAFLFNDSILFGTITESGSIHAKQFCGIIECRIRCHSTNLSLTIVTPTSSYILLCDDDVTIQKQFTETFSHAKKEIKSCPVGQVKRAMFNIDDIPIERKLVRRPSYLHRILHFSHSRSPIRNQTDPSPPPSPPPSKKHNDKAISVYAFAKSIGSNLSGLISKTLFNPVNGPAMPPTIIPSPTN